MDFTWIFYFFVSVVAVKSSFNLKGNVTVTCHIKQSLLNSDYKLHLGLNNRFGNASYNVSYCLCNSLPYKCTKLNACKWKKASCIQPTPKGDNLCSSFLIWPVSFWSYDEKFIIRIYEKLSTEKGPLDEFVMKRTSFLNQCFLDHRPELVLSDGDVQYSVDISWNLRHYDKRLTFGSPATVTLFSYETGKQLPVTQCKSRRPCFGYRNPCKCTIQNLVPCQKYRVCVRTNLFGDLRLDESKLTTCKNYTVPHGVIPRIGTMEMRPDVVKGVTRFSWIDSSHKNKAGWFYRTQFTLRGENASVMTNETKITALELTVPSGTEKCAFSVAKCVICKCGIATEGHFKKCAVHDEMPELSEQIGQAYSDNRTETKIIIGSVGVAIFVLIVIGLLFLLFKRSLLRTQEPHESQDLPVLNEIVPRNEDCGLNNAAVLDHPYHAWPTSYPEQVDS